LRITGLKPRAIIYLDDRAIRFEGTYPTIEQIRDLEVPWNQKS
jgi:hypothetical protein